MDEKKITYKIYGTIAALATLGIGFFAHGVVIPFFS